MRHAVAIVMLMVLVLLHGPKDGPKEPGPKENPGGGREVHCEEGRGCR